VSLDTVKQKQLMGDQPSNSSSSTSLNSVGGRLGAGGVGAGGAGGGRGGKAPRQPSAGARGAYRAVESSGMTNLFIYLLARDAASYERPLLLGSVCVRLSVCSTACATL